MARLSVFVLDRGLVRIGRPRPDPDDFLFLLLDDCCCVRRWGTDRGLGQIASEGPQPETVLDPEGDGVRVNKRYVILEIPGTWDRSRPDRGRIPETRFRAG